MCSRGIHAAVGRRTSQNVRKQYFQTKQTRKAHNVWRDVVRPSRCNAFAIARFLVSISSPSGSISVPNFEFLASSIPKIWRGSQNSKIGSRDPFTTPFDRILHFGVVPPVINLSVRIDRNIFIGDRHIWQFYLFLDLAVKCLFGPILGRFLGFDPLNVIRYCRDPKRHILGRKHAF